MPSELMTIGYNAGWTLSNEMEEVSEQEIYQRLNECFNFFGFSDYGFEAVGNCIDDWSDDVMDEYFGFAELGLESSHILVTPEQEAAELFSLFFINAENQQ